MARKQTRPTRSGRSSGPTQRQLRVGELVRHALSTILLRDPLRDPVMAGVSVTISEVRASPDLRHAKVFCVPLGGENQDEVLEVMNRSASYLRGALGRELALKYTPELAFVLDESFDEASRINAILRSGQVSKDISAVSSDARSEDNTEED